MAESAASLPARPGVVLGLTLLLIGMTFALPAHLLPSQAAAAVSDKLVPETANVYAFVAWAGLAHFFFSFRGQTIGLLKTPLNGRSSRLTLLVVGILMSLGALLWLRWVAGPSIFGAVVWIYFIDHFIKAEQTFEGARPAKESVLSRWLASYQSLLSFGWLSFVLLDVGHVDGHHWILWIVSGALAGVVLAFGGWRQLSGGDVRGPLISLFFVFEAMVWGAFSHYGGPQFLFGVYVFHIAAGSYFHYLGSYFFGNAKSMKRDRLLGPWPILGVNATMLALGYLVAHSRNFVWLSPMFGVQWFTLWVGLHLVVSDLFPAVKAWRPGG